MGASTKATGPLAGQMQNMIQARNQAVRDRSVSLRSQGQPAFLGVTPSSVGNTPVAPTQERAPGLEATPKAPPSVPAPATSPYGLSPGIGRPSLFGEDPGQRRMKSRGRSGILFGPGRSTRMPEQGSPEYEQLLQRVRGLAQM